MQLSQACAPDRETSSVSPSHCHRSDRTVLREKANLISLFSRSRLRPFSHVALRLQLRDFLAQPIGLLLLCLHLAVASKGALGIGSRLPDSLAQHGLMQFQIMGSLSHRYARILHRP